jgi:alcohol dehydrogenase
VDGCDCEETLRLIAESKLNIEPLITHTYPLSKIDEAYELFESKCDGVIKVAIEC